MIKKYFENYFAKIKNLQVKPTGQRNFGFMI